MLMHKVRAQSCADDMPFNLKWSNSLLPILKQTTLPFTCHLASLQHISTIAMQSS